MPTLAPEGPIACPPARARGLGVLVCVVLAAALLSRASFLFHPFDGDSPVFVYMGRLIAEGGRYWVDLIDNKLPTVALLMSPAWRAAGAAWWPYVLGQTLLSLLACWMLGRAAARAAGEHAFWPACLFALVYLNLHHAVSGGFQLETIQAFFAVCAAGAAIEVLVRLRSDARSVFADAFVVGLAAGMAAYCKPSGLAAMAALGLVLLIELPHRPLRTIGVGLASLAGLAVPGGVFAIYLLQTDTLQHLPANWRQMSDYLAHSATASSEVLLKLGWAFVLVGFPMLIRGWVHRRDRVEVDPSPHRLVLRFAFAWLALELLAVILQRRMYAYQFLPLAAPAALLFGLIPRRLRVAPTAVALAPVMLLSLGSAIPKIFETDNPGPAAMSRFLTASAAPGDRLWADAYPRTLIETGLQPGSRVPLTFLFFNTDDAPAHFSREILHDFDVRRPEWIILPSDLDRYLASCTMQVFELERRPQRRQNFEHAWREIERYVHTNYEPIQRIDRDTLYRRRDVKFFTDAR